MFLAFTQGAYKYITYDCWCNLTSAFNNILFVSKGEQEEFVKYVFPQSTMPQNETPTIGFKSAKEPQILIIYCLVHVACL